MEKEVMSLGFEQDFGGARSFQSYPADGGGCAKVSRNTKIIVFWTRKMTWGECSGVGHEGGRLRAWNVETGECGQVLEGWRASSGSGCVRVASGKVLR